MNGHNSSLKAFLIDLDGTLVDTLPYLFMAYENSLKKLGLNGGSDEFEKLNGATYEEIIQTLQKKHHLSSSQVEAYSESYLSYLKDEKHLQNLQIVKGAKEFLDAAKKMKLSLAVVSSSKIWWIEGVLKAMKIDHFFDVIISGDQVKKSKPDPEGYLKALVELNCPVEQARAIEDSSRGVQAAVNAGLKTFALLYEPGEDFSNPLFSSPLVTKAYKWHDILKYLKSD